MPISLKHPLSPVAEVVDPSDQPSKAELEEAVEIP